MSVKTFNGVSAIKTINGVSAIKTFNGVTLAPPDIITIHNFALSSITGGVRIVFDSITESNIDPGGFFLISRDDGFGYSGIATFGATGSGSHYIYDDLVDPGTHTYKLTCYFNDGTTFDPVGGSDTITT